MKDKLVLTWFEMRPACIFFFYKFQLISEIRSLSADCLPSLLGASACGVSASQLFGRSVAIFFHPIRITGKKLKNIIRCEITYSFFMKPFQLISEIRSLSADCLPNRIKASACGVSASQFFGRSVANFFDPFQVCCVRDAIPIPYCLKTVANGY